MVYSTRRLAVSQSTARTPGALCTSFLASQYFVTSSGGVRASPVHRMRTIVNVPSSRALSPIRPPAQRAERLVQKTSPPCHVRATEDICACLLSNTRVRFSFPSKRMVTMSYRIKCARRSRRYACTVPVLAPKLSAISAQVSPCRRRRATSRRRGESVSRNSWAHSSPSAIHSMLR